MRKLKRPLPAPPCLSSYNYNTQKWKGRVPSNSCKTAIWSELMVMQSGFCVYCESVAVKGKGHIEHFRYKGKKSDGIAPFKHLTFDWNNLFGCCGLKTSNTCGHYKDREGDEGPGAYDPNHLIQPDVDDPSNFLNFLDTGVIEIKPNLSESNSKKASETIRVLNLESLNGARKRQIQIFKNELNTLQGMSQQLDTQSLNTEMENIKARVRQAEFQTAVLDSLF